MNYKNPNMKHTEEELDSMPFEKVRTIIYRAGYGKDGLGEYRESLLCDMNDGWIEASISYVTKEHPHRKYYIKELNYRKHNKRKEIINKLIKK